MARINRVELFEPGEIAIVHVISRVVRRCFLLGDDPISGKNYDHRKVWIQERMKLLAANFGVDLLAYSILSNHVHQVVRSRPDIVKGWNDSDVARRWLTICPGRRSSKKQAEPTEAELNSIRTDPAKLAEIRSRLSDISWWMRLLNQPTARRANQEDNHTGHFWHDRYKAVRLLDESAVLACAAYVDLNPIRAAMAETLETSQYTSAMHRCAAAVQSQVPNVGSNGEAAHQVLEQGCGWLSPVHAEEAHGPIGAQPSLLPSRASDRGFLPISELDYLELLDWTARQIAPGKNPKGVTPADAPAILARLKIQPSAWCLLVGEFGRMFLRVAGQPHRIDEHRGRLHGSRYHLPAATRHLLSG